MKKWLSLLAVVFTVSMTTVSLEAEAKRVGGGKSFGMQRQATPPAKAPNATPAQTPAAAPAAAGAASSRSKWMGPIAGLAAGLGLAALASHLGFGEELANMLMIGLLVMAVLAVIGFVMRKKAAAQGGGMAYAGAGAGGLGSSGPASGAPQNQAFKMASPAAAQGGSMIGSALGGGQGAPAGRPNIPADFDVAAFVRNAKVNFIRLQASNDAGNLDDIRQFTTPEMFAEIQMDFRERGGASQQTEVEQLEADVLEVAEDGAMYVVSVRFTGNVREDGVLEHIDEIWHLTKPRHVPGGWLLAGIQQSQ